MERTKKKINLMKHALGIDVRNFRKGQTKHECYRNYFATKKDELCEELVEDGYAGHNEELNQYYVTALGMEYLSDILDIKIGW